MGGGGVVKEGVEGASQGNSLLTQHNSRVHSRCDNLTANTAGQQLCQCVGKEYREKVLVEHRP